MKKIVTLFAALFICTFAMSQNSPNNTRAAAPKKSQTTNPLRDDLKSNCTNKNRCIKKQDDANGGIRKQKSVKRTQNTH